LPGVIARRWRAWAFPAAADAYERHFGEVVLPALEAVPGFDGAVLLRRDAAGESELVALTFFDSMASVEGFAGSDPERAVVHEEARQLLTRWDDRAAHYQVARYSR
jgi:heme-degrading monooxygenase HmoA